MRALMCGRARWARAVQGDGSAAELVNRLLTFSLVATFLMLVGFTLFNLSAGAFMSPVNHWNAVPNILPICLQVRALRPP
jgi:hypothetical protein